jgi:type I restriction enzyme S subunit
VSGPYRTEKLGNLCHIARGGSPRPIQDYLTSDADGINWVKISDATASGKFIEITKEKIRPEGVKRSRLVKPGDFVLSNSMSFGRPYIMKTTGCIHDGWLVLSDKCGLFDQDYLYHFLGSDAAYRQFDGLAAGSTVRNLNSDLVKTVDVPLPSLDEQRRIVAVLDEAFAAIATATANAEKNLANARELLRGYLDNILSDRESKTEDSTPWERVPLGEVCDVLDRLRKPVTKSDRRSGEYPYYGATGIVDWVDDYIFDEPLILLGEDGAKWGPGEQSAFSASGKYWVNNHAHVLRPKREILSDEWLIYYLNMSDLMPYIMGVTVPKLNQERMRSIPISLPPLEQQHQLVAKMSALSEQATGLIAVNKDKLKALSSLKQSLLHRAFAGELTQPERELVPA